MMRDQLPEPRPSFIEFEGDRFIVDPGPRGGAAHNARLDTMLAMTPTERLRWHEAWRQFIRACERRGDSVEAIAAAVYGNTPSDEPR
jgi:hypothetical protein